VWLTLRTGEHQGRQIEVSAEELVLGRDDDCGLVLADPKVSRRHARLRAREDGTVELTDLGSSNGTFVNGERVETRVLEGGEQIQCGDCVLASSREQPGTIRAGTILGSGLFLRQEWSRERIRTRRSVRRAISLAGAGLALVTAGAILLFTGAIRLGDDTSEAVKRVVRGARSGTVLVVAREGSAQVGTGSGWVLDGGRGLIVTNAHVLNGGRVFEVGWGNELQTATVVGMAPCEDLAVLRVPRPRGLRALRMAAQGTLELGETVVAVGFPLNASGETTLTSTAGVISVARGSYQEKTLDVPRYPNVVQIDAAFNPGNSGGPLLDLEGRLVGVNSAGRTITHDGRIVQGQNYAIGVDRVREVVRVLRTGRSLGWSGLSFDYPTAKELARSKGPIGLRIRQVVALSGGDQAGLLRRRGMLLAVNGRRLDNSLASYCDAVEGLGTGRKVMLTVLPPGATKPKAVQIRLR